MRKQIFYRIVRPIITVLFKVLYRPTIIGKEYIPKDGCVVLAGNHTNNFDCLLLISSTSRTIHFLAKSSLLKGLKGILFRGMGIIPVDRSRKNPESLKTAIEVLKEGGVIGIFPEGTINRTRDVTMPFKYGAVKMSRESSSFLVPFVITGKYQIFRKGIHIQFLEPYKIKGDLEKENECLRKKISFMLEQSREDL